jgi:putative ABC transport system permease protein
VNRSIYQLSLLDVGLSLLPLVAVLVVLYSWRVEVRGTLYATARMLGQLALVGYVLKLVLTSDVPSLVVAIFVLMVAIAAWIALRPIANHRRQLLPHAFLALLTTTLPILALLLFVVIRPKPWYLPSYSIPLAGMVVANAMNVLSLAAERHDKERSGGAVELDARRAALRAALIPPTNTFLAVGLVSLPGMMTGQILAGIDPLIAARYQIMIMAAVYSAGALSAALFLVLRHRAAAVPA